MNHDVRPGSIGDAQCGLDRPFRPRQSAGIRIVSDCRHMDLLEGNRQCTRFGASSSTELLTMEHVLPIADKLDSELVLSIGLQVEHAGGEVRILSHLDWIEQPPGSVAAEHREIHSLDFRWDKTSGNVQHDSHRMEISICLGRPSFDGEH